MENNIKLYSRYGTCHWLKKLIKSDGQDSTVYVIKTDSPTIRVGYNNEKKKFIDLPGGPCITEGSVLEGTDKKVVSLDFIAGYGHVVTFES